jgi:hypothetical protein
MIPSLLRFFFAREALTLRRLRQAPPTPIGEARGGEVVTIAGRVRLVGPSRAPMTGRRGALWRVTLDEPKGEAGGWRLVLRADELTDFVVDDGTGVALVSGPASEMTMAWSPSTAAPPLSGSVYGVPDYNVFLQRHQITERDLFGFKRALRFREVLVAAGTRVVVRGVGRWEPDPDPAARDHGYRELAQRLVLRAPARDLLLISDDPTL